MVRASKGNMIWVAGNYRVCTPRKLLLYIANDTQLGAYGFLTGTTTEKTATPNVGFYDQRAVLEWIQKYISLVGGDSKTVTSMGISAGAGSIVHHLLFNGGKMDPLFTRAIIQSPGYTNYQDRAGELEGNYKKFEEAAGCAGKGIPCLRALDEDTLKVASDKANSGQRPGTFAFGPAPDGSLILRTPAQEFEAGMFFSPPLEKFDINGIYREVLEGDGIDHLFSRDKRRRHVHRQ
jgi:carboxylesterase type B